MNISPSSYSTQSRHDISSGFVVFLVALPLYVGVALAPEVFFVSSKEAFMACTAFVIWMCWEQVFFKKKHFRHMLQHSLETVVVGGIIGYIGYFLFSLYPDTMSISLPCQAAITPLLALHFLQDGNIRFVDQHRKKRDFAQQVKATSSAQQPFAIVLSCIDSRVPPEIIFDQGIGDIFSARIAGNFVNEDILGSMEYACKVVNAKLIVVLGHTDCGAIKATCDCVDMGYVTQLTTKLIPAVEAVKTNLGTDRSSKNTRFVNQVSEQNVHITRQQIMLRSPILKELVEQQQLAIVGGLYDVATGKVAFLDGADKNENNIM